MNIMINVGEHILVVGQTGSGKTWFIRLNLVQLYPRVVVYDTKGVDPWDEWIDAWKVWTVEQLAEAIISGQPRIHYKARNQTREDRVTEIDQICNLLLQVGHHCLIIDEASHVCNSSSIPSNLEMYITSARGVGGTLILGSQRAVSLVHPTIRTQCLHKFMGFLDPEDRQNPTVRRAFPIDHNPSWKSYLFIYFGPDGIPSIIVP